MPKADQDQPAQPATSQDQVGQASACQGLPPRSTKWDDKYRADATPYLHPIAFVSESIKQLTPGQALDVACGPGRHSIALAQAGWQVHAVDNSTVACDMLRATAQPNITITNADLENGQFPIPESTYDLIIVCCYLQRSLMPAIRAGIKPGGHALMVIPMVDDRAGVRTMNREYLLTPGELRGIFSDWEIVGYNEGIPADARRLQAQLLARKPNML